MHLHIIGVCGTFMGGIAAIAREAGHRVTGSDRNVYPPMSTQLAALGVDVIEGYEPDQLKLKPDVFVIGNVMSRGNALIEALLDSGARYESGPEWLARNVLHDRWVLGVAGNHRPVLVAYPLSYDWMWLHWYFTRFAEGGSPFGYSQCLDLKTMIATALGVTNDRANKHSLPVELQSDRPHTHHAIDDAIEQADLFAKVFAHLRR